MFLVTLILNWPIWQIRSITSAIKSNIILSPSLKGLKGSKSRKSFPRCVLGLTFSGVKEQNNIRFKKVVIIPNSFTRWLVAEERTMSIHNVIHNSKVNGELHDESSSIRAAIVHAGLYIKDHPSLPFL